MLFLAALAISVLFVYFCGEILKKHPYPFYAGAAAVTAVIFWCDFSNAPEWVGKWIVGLFSKGALGTALFVIVMYAGAMKNGTKRIAAVMKIRGELSIFAAILVLSHNLTYGKVYFKYLFTRPELLSTCQLTAAIISCVLITIMIILTVTSFPQIRRKMNAKSWKKLQRSAYVFYGLIYIHILLINIPYAKRGIGEYVFNVAVYSIVFVSYGVKRIRKYLLIKNRNKISENTNIEKKINIFAVIINVFVVLCVVVCSLPKSAEASDNKNSAKTAYKENEKQSSSFMQENSDGDSAADEETTQASLEITENNENGNEEATDSNTLNSETSDNAASNNDETAGNISSDAVQPDDTQLNSEASDSETKALSVSNVQGSQNGEAVSNAQANEMSNPASSQQQTTVVTETQTEQQTAKKEPETTVKRTYKADGEYSASAVVKNYYYNVYVAVTIKDDKVSKVSITSDAEDIADIEYADDAINGLTPKLAASDGSDGIDAVSGATYTSNAIFKAYDEALGNAKN